MMTIAEIEETDAASQALVYAQQVAAGAKLAAEMQVHAGLAEVVSETAAREGCKTRVKVQGTWEIVTIYKYRFVKQLVSEMDARRPGQGPPSMLDVWTAGKLFGYSDYEIAQFLQDAGYIEAALM